MIQKNFSEFFRGEQEFVKKKLSEGLKQADLVRYYLERDDVDMSKSNIKKWLKRIKDGYQWEESAHKALLEECKSIGIPPEEVNHYWYKGKSFSIHVKPKVLHYFEVRDDLIKDMSEHAPVYPEIKYKPIDKPHLLVIDLADVHVGKLAR